MACFSRLAVLLLLLQCALITGCADGPFGGFASVNPWIKSKWAEDEKFGPTFHRRLADLRALRGSAARLEGAKKEQIASEMARLLVSEQNPVIRSEMTGVLGEIGLPQAAPGLYVAVKDTDKDVRIAACQAWGRIGQASVPVLAELIDLESDVDVRLAAIRELGKFQDPVAVAALGKSLDDNDPAVQHLAVQSLKASTGRDLGDSVPAWRDFVQGREPQLPPSPSIVERINRWF